MPWFVYILKCQNDNLYTGITNDVEKRMAAHRAGKGARYTRAFGVASLLYQERHSNKSLALKREAEIKSWPRVKKMGFIRLKKKTKQKNDFSKR